MLRIDKTYTFEGPEGPTTLLDLFDGQRQLELHKWIEEAGRTPGWK